MAIDDSIETRMNLKDEPYRKCSNCEGYSDIKHFPRNYRCKTLGTTFLKGDEEQWANECHHFEPEEEEFK